MSFLSTWLRKLGFWVGPFLLLGSALLGIVLVLVAAHVAPPAIVLLVVPAGGLLLGAWLIIRGTQPRWAKVLAFLSPVVVPLLLLMVWLASLSGLPIREPGHLTFYIPAGFRGEVTLIHGANVGQPLPRTNDELLLLVPPTGLITTSDELDADWLAEADYYFTNPAGQRLSPLRQLREADFAHPQTPGSWSVRPAGNRREVGVFAAEGLQYKPSEFAKYYPNVPGDTHTPGVAYLTFTVACYDSLAGLMRRPPF